MAEESHLGYAYTTPEDEEQDEKVRKKRLTILPFQCYLIMYLFRQVESDREASSADFDEFKTVKSSKRKRPRRPQIKEFRETDRIDAPSPGGGSAGGDHFVFEVRSGLAAKMNQTLTKCMVQN